MVNLLFFLVVAGLFALAARYPGAACGYVLAGTALEQCAQALVPIANSQNTLCNYLTAGAVVIGLVGRLFHDRTALPRIRTSTMWVLTLLGYCYLTAVWSIFPGTTIGALNRAIPYLATFVGMAPLLIKSSDDLRHCLTALMFTTMGALGLLLFFAEWGMRGVVLPGKDYEGNPLALAESAGCLLIVTAFAPIRTKVSPAMRLSLLTAAVGITALVFLRTASRGQVLASIAATLAFSVRQRGGGWIILALGVGGLLAFGLMPEEVAKNAQRWDPEQMRSAVDTGRVHEAERLLSAWSNSSTVHQVLGLGHAASQDPRLLGNYPHVVPAEVLGEEGIVGAILFGITILVGALAHFRGLAHSDPSTHRVLAATAALLAFEFALIWKQGSLLGSSPLLLLLTMAPEPIKSRVRRRDARSNAASRTRAFAPAGLGPPHLRTRGR